MSLQAEHPLPHQGAVLLLRSTQTRIVASSQNGGATVIEHSGDGDEQRFKQRTTLELGKLWDIACLKDHLLVANRDGTVRLWSLTTKEAIKDFQGHEEDVRAVHFLDERTFVSADITGVIRIWDLTSGECLHVLRGHEGDVVALASHGEVLVSGSYDKCVRIWSITKGECLHVLEGHDTGIGILGWNKDHTLIATGASGGAVKIWQISDGKWIADCSGHTKLPTRVIDRGGQLVTASADGTVREWDWQSGRAIKSIQVHDGDNPAVRAMEFFGDNGQMITAGMDGKVKQWDFPCGRCTNEILVTEGAIWAGTKIGENSLAITGRVEEDAQYLKILSLST